MTRGFRHMTGIPHSWVEEKVVSLQVGMNNGRMGGMPWEQFQPIYANFRIQNCTVCGSIRRKGGIYSWSGIWETVAQDSFQPQTPRAKQTNLKLSKIDTLASFDCQQPHKVLYEDLGDSVISL